jgi:hypothetical protein
MIHSTGARPVSHSDVVSRGIKDDACDGRGGQRRQRGHGLSAYVSIRRHTSAYVSIRQHTSAYASIRQHTSAYVSVTGEEDSGASEATGCGKPKGHTDSIRQHASACVSIRQHTSADVSIRQHTSAYVSIRQQT